MAVRDINQPSATQGIMAVLVCSIGMAISLCFVVDMYK